MEILASCPFEEPVSDYKIETGQNNAEQTNEEWFCGLSTKEKAKFLGETAWKFNNRFDYTNRATLWDIWLKAVHKE